MEEKNPNRLMSQIALVLGIWFFSSALVAFNIFFGWEKWVIPLFVVFCALSLILHVRQKPAENVRVNLFVALLLGELFYYYAHIPNVYDGTAVVILLMGLFALRRLRRRLCLRLFVLYLPLWCRRV